jgi:hypothetical protein
MLFEVDGGGNAIVIGVQPNTDHPGEFAWLTKPVSGPSVELAIMGRREGSQ